MAIRRLSPRVAVVAHDLERFGQTSGRFHCMKDYPDACEALQNTSPTRNWLLIQRPEFLDPFLETRSILKLAAQGCVSTQSGSN